MRIAPQLLVLSLLVAVGTPIRADLIMPGQKAVRHEVVVEIPNPDPDILFVAYPTSFQNTWTEIQPGVPFTFYKHQQPKLYAIRGKRPPQDPQQAETYFKDPSLPHSEVSLRIISVVDLCDPTDRIRTVYRITGVEGTHISVEKGPDERFGGDGKAMTSTQAAVWTVVRKTGAIGGIVAFGVVGIVFLRRRRARKAAEARS